MEFLSWPHDRTPRTATFISDLHLFSSRSDFDRHRMAIERAVAESEMCVWGGDLFDFRWTRLMCESKTVNRAIEWLAQWLEDFPETSFVFLRGNHDASPELCSALKQLVSVHPHLYGGVDALRVHDTLMLHGDLMEGLGTRNSLALYRQSWQQKRIAGHMQNRFYDAAVTARLHTAVASAVHRHRATCRRLWRSIDGEFGEEVQGIRRVVFGHTHRHIDRLRVAGVDFYNGGAAIRHVKFQPVRLQFDQE